MKCSGKDTNAPELIVLFNKDKINNFLNFEL